LTLLPFLAIFPLSCIQVAMLLVINFPDAQGDAAVGKRTLVQVLGNKLAIRLYLALISLAYIAQLILVNWGLPPVVSMAILLLSPIGLWQSWRMAKGGWADPEMWNSLGFWSIGLLVMTGTFELLAFIYLL
jgi:1,4-dihydroxy-2-naphthoate octaprenyltransferase